MSHRTKTETFRILAKDCMMSNDSRKTGLNNNDFIVGQSGSGKTQSYVIPNILQANESMVIADTKGNLVKKLGPFLKKEGYQVELIDFKRMQSTCRYNPLEYISYDSKRGAFSTVDILKIVNALVPMQAKWKAFWTDSARKYMALLISVVMDFMPAQEHTLKNVVKLCRLMNTGAFETMMSEICDKHPDCYSSHLYQEIRRDQIAADTYQCVLMHLSTRLTTLTFDDALDMYDHFHSFHFRSLGRRKAALFLNISDTDRSMDRLISLLYIQALQDLCDFADHECPGNRLPVPVRFLMDDFATNTYIEDFDKIISVIRSRGISVSIIIQSLGQLNSLYGESRAGTILDNVDNMLFLNGHSLETVDYIAQRANVPTETIMNMGVGEAYLFTSGRSPKIVHKFDLSEHVNYNEISENKI